MIIITGSGKKLNSSRNHVLTHLVQGHKHGTKIFELQKKPQRYNHLYLKRVTQSNGKDLP